MVDVPRRYPPPVLQASRKAGCFPSCVAFVCRWFGIDADEASVTAAHKRGRSDYPLRYNIPMQIRTQDRPEDRSLWRLGPRAQPWVQDRLIRGQIGISIVERVIGIRHAVVLVEPYMGGVMVMDPLSGYMVENWDTILGDGPGRQISKAGVWRRLYFVHAWYWSSADQS